MADGIQGFTINPHAPAVVFDDGDWDELTIPRRPWIAPGYYLRGSITALVGAAGVSKSTLVVAHAVALALGEAFHKMRPVAPCRVLVYNVEDDQNEQRRRLSGALMLMGRKPSDIRGKS